MRGVSGLNVIPEMTDPLGRHWEQPKREDIVLSKKQAYVSKNSLRKLKDYSRSIPSGVYAGKMWKVNYKKQWALAWFDHINSDGNFVIEYRDIVTVS